MKIDVSLQARSLLHSVFLVEKSLLSCAVAHPARPQPQLNASHKSCDQLSGLIKAVVCWTKKLQSLRASHPLRVFLEGKQYRNQFPIYFQ